MKIKQILSFILLGLISTGTLLSASQGTGTIYANDTRDSITVNASHGWYKGHYNSFDQHGHMKVWAENRYTKADSDDNHPNQYVKLVSDVYPEHPPVTQTKYMSTAHVSQYINRTGDVGWADRPA